MGLLEIILNKVVDHFVSRKSILQAPIFIFFIRLWIYFIYLAAPALQCFVQASSSCDEQRLLCAAVGGLLTAVASSVAERGP